MGVAEYARNALADDGTILLVEPFANDSELVFTLYRRPDVSDQEFAEDAKSVENDLVKLKTLLEK